MRTSPPPPIAPKSVKTIYISGPISGLDITEATLAFTRATELCRNLGYKVVNPMTLAPYDPALEWVDYMEKDLTALILDCDAVFVLEGSQLSKGARLEITVAVCLDMPIYHAGCMPPNVEDEKVEVAEPQPANSLAKQIIWMAMGGLIVACYHLLVNMVQHA